MASLPLPIIATIHLAREDMSSAEYMNCCDMLVFSEADVVDDPIPSVTESLEPKGKPKPRSKLLNIC